ncbi:MAG: hypothetical protein K2X27_06705 [Candidatus Obscuribacterales bacterium]|nr:hypothetical protein [Candidatus Obscuribacterales bacterium]
MKDLPTVEECRERLIRMLEQVDGDKHHPNFVRFWKQRAACENEYEMKLFERLAAVWDELTTPPGKAIDAFSAFGIGGIEP